VGVGGGGGACGDCVSPAQLALVFRPAAPVAALPCVLRPRTQLAVASLPTCAPCGSFQCTSSTVVVAAIQARPSRAPLPSLPSTDPTIAATNRPARSPAQHSSAHRAALFRADRLLSTRSTCSTCHLPCLLADALHIARHDSLLSSRRHVPYCIHKISTHPVCS